MLIDEITSFCDKEYKSQDTRRVCVDCNHTEKCSGGCKECLEEVHYPLRYPNGKKITTVRILLIFICVITLSNTLPKYYTC